jgi:hypothetical protein
MKTANYSHEGSKRVMNGNNTWGIEEVHLQQFSSSFDLQIEAPQSRDHYLIEEATEYEGSFISEFRIRSMYVAMVTIPPTPNPKLRSQYPSHVYQSQLLKSGNIYSE